LSLSSLPLEDGVPDVAAQLGVEPAAFAASAGEDYELCVCVPAATWKTLETTPASDRLNRAGLTRVGEVVEGPAAIVFTDATGALTGYEHSF
jgi:thiamine-monophosphate kinase